MVNEKFLVIDTETTNSLEDPICYDVGVAVVDGKGEVFETRSYAVEEIFGYPDLMSSAFYASKLPLYMQEIKEGTREVRKYKQIRLEVFNLLYGYGIKRVSAHNARFDYLALNLTQRFLTCSKYRYFFPYGVEIWDTLNMARQVLGKSPAYRKFCLENGYTTKRHQSRFTAEILYRFISNQPSFVEAHMGLQDVLIEKEILAYCLAQYPNIDGRLWKDRESNSDS